MSPAISPSQLVYLPKSLVASEDTDSFDVVHSVVSFTHEMIHKGHYRPEELPANIISLYWSDYYLGQVQNGGHSQFIENTIDDGLSDVIAAARNGLASMGAHLHNKPLIRLESWLRDSGFLEEFAEEPGFDDDAWEYLEALDNDFLSAENQSSSSNLAKAWLLTWENLRIIEDEQLSLFRNEQLNSKARFT